MKQLPRLILACAAFATCAVAGAQSTNYDAAADQERRTRNREEALAKYHAMQDRRTDNTARTDSRGGAAGGPTLGDRARTAGKSVRNFTHRQAEKARDFSERQDRKWEKRGAAKNQGTNRNKTRGTPD
jgi:hypothetical protein